MEMHIDRDDVRKPYEPPIVRELGRVAEVTLGAAVTPNVRDNGVASVV